MVKACVGDGRRKWRPEPGAWVRVKRLGLCEFVRLDELTGKYRVVKTITRGRLHKRLLFLVASASVHPVEA
jgi:hypothetical protein